MMQYAFHVIKIRKNNMVFQTNTKENKTICQEFIFSPTRKCSLFSDKFIRCILYRSSVILSDCAIRGNHAMACSFEGRYHQSLLTSMPSQIHTTLILFVTSRIETQALRGFAVLKWIVQVNFLTLLDLTFCT